MSETDPGKEHYSMQEMMDRLREGRGTGGHGGGRRRRRSHQPVKETRQRRNRWLLVTIVLVGLLFVGVLVVGMLNSLRIKGEVFRQEANRRLSAMARAEADCDRFIPRGWRGLDCPNIHFKGAGDVFKDALLQNLSAELSTVSIFRNEWDAEMLTVGKAALEFQIPAAPRRADDDPSLVVRDAAGSDGFRLGVSAQPNAVVVKSLLVDQLDVTWPDSRNQPTRLVEMKARGSYRKETLELSATGGRFSSPTWGEMPLVTLTATYAAGELKIESARLRMAEDRHLMASGGIHFGRDGASAELKIDIDPCQLKDILRPAWQKRVHGKFIPGKLAFTAKPGFEEELTGEFSIDGLVLENFPGLAVLSGFFKTELYQKLEFRQFSAKFRRTPSQLRIYDINGNRQGEARLAGEVTLFADGRMEGRLRLALNTVEKNLPEFSGEEDGLDVIEVNLGGTEDQPADDLAAKFPVAKPTPESEPAPQ